MSYNMNKLNISELVWDEFNSNHINKHGVSKTEIYEACQNILYTGGAKFGRISIVAQTESGRYLTIILAYKSYDSYYPVSARDANKKEKEYDQNSKI